MSSSVSQVKTALTTKLGTISGLRTYAYQPDQVNAPMGWAILDGIEYHGAMGPGLITMNFRVAIIVGRASERSAQSRLDAYLSYDNGVRSVLESDPTLGNITQALVVESASEISSIDAGAESYFYIEFKVACYV